MKTPQVKPNWNTGIYTGYGVATPQELPLINDKQMISLERKWLQSNDGLTWKQFQDSVMPSIDSSIVVRWCGMYLQIETDGYCHT